MEYYFYVISDPLKEKIAKGRANSIDEAMKMFAILKGLDINEFRKIYAVGIWNPA
jgi:hypothetical protein